MIKPTNFMNFHLTILHIYPFVMVKIQTHFYQIIQKNIVPDYQTNSKNIFGRKKLNSPITSNFVPIINLTNSS